MHLLFIGISVAPVSGYGTMADFHCGTFFEKGVPFTLLLPRSAQRVPVPYSKNIRYVLPDLPLSFNSLFNILRLPFLFSRIQLPPTVFSAVHSLVDFPYAVLGHRIARRRNIPFFFSAHGTYAVRPFKKAVDRHLFMPAYKGAERIFAMSSFTANAMQEAAVKRKGPVDVLYLPVREPTKPMQGVSSPLPLPEGARVILAVGSMKERKGIETLIMAMPFVVRTVPRAQLFVVAAGNDAPCRSLARERGVLDRIHFMKNLSADALFFLFEQSAVFALTPRYTDHEFEGYGLVYGEAGWHRLPVVASLSGGVPEAVIHGVTGLLVPENNERETARALCAILTDAALASRLGAGGYAFARSRTASAYTDYLIRTYEEYQRT